MIFFFSFFWTRTDVAAVVDISVTQMQHMREK
jgi:hypothetical protein